MALRQSYENKEINDIRWIYGAYNLTDAIIKATFNKVIKIFIENNQIILKLKK